LSEKLGRLLSLTATLLETVRPLTANEIGERVEGYPSEKVAFQRAFERDKDDLREMGIEIDLKPIAFSDPPADGYRIDKDTYYLRDPKLEPDELAALHLAISTVRLDGIEGTSGLWKLGGVLRAPNSATTQPVTAIPADERLVTLFDAVSTRRLATFTYRDVARTVEPRRLDFARGRWYLSSFDRTRDAARVFRLDRIEGDLTIGPPSGFPASDEPHPGARLEPWQLGEGDPVTGRVLVDPGMAPLAVMTVGPEAVVETRDDGSVVVELTVTNVDGLRAFVLGFLEHAELLEPADLRADIVAWLETVAQQ
jgi:predicted DNA-binding transcriptional regulator YafY